MPRSAGRFIGFPESKIVELEEPVLGAGVRAPHTNPLVFLQFTYQWPKRAFIGPKRAFIADFGEAEVATVCIQLQSSGEPILVLPISFTAPERRYQDGTKKEAQ
jgi:hypothetical protein